MLGGFGEVLVFGDDIAHHFVVNDQLVASLLEGHAVDLLALDGIGNIILVHPDDAIGAFSLGFEDFEGFGFIAGGDHAVGHFALNHLRGGNVAYVGQRDEIAVAGHSVRAARLGIGAGKGRKLQIVDEVNLLQHVGKRGADGRACRADVLEGSGGAVAGGLLEFADELPAVESVEQVDVAGSAVEHFNGQFAAVLHKNAGRLLIRVASVFEHHFVHIFQASFQIFKRIPVAQRRNSSA